jgi:hypothetical protein
LKLADERLGDALQTSVLLDEAEQLEWITLRGDPANLSVIASRHLGRRTYRKTAAGAQPATGVIEASEAAPPVTVPEIRPATNTPARERQNEVPSAAPSGASGISCENAAQARRDALSDFMKQQDSGAWIHERPVALRAIQADGFELGTTASVVTRIVRVVQDARSEGDGANPLPWGRFRAFLWNILSDAGVLLDRDGQAIPVTMLTFSREVSAVRPDAELRCEAFMLRRLLPAFVINESALGEVALAFYGNADAGLDRVTELVSYLLDNKLAKVGPDGRLVPQDPDCGTDCGPVL